jgi:hypothetical protein
VASKNDVCHSLSLSRHKDLLVKHSSPLKCLCRFLLYPLCDNRDRVTSIQASQLRSLVQFSIKEAVNFLVLLLFSFNLTFFVLKSSHYGSLQIMPPQCSSVAAVYIRYPWTLQFSQHPHIYNNSLHLCIRTLISASNYPLKMLKCWTYLLIIFDSVFSK